MTVSTASIGKRDEHGHRAIKVHGTVTVGTVSRDRSGMDAITWFLVHDRLHPDIKREVTELAERTVALENVAKRLLA